jgi:hypothetical protein
MAVAIAASPLFGSIFSLIFIVIFGLAFGIPYLRNKKRKQLLATGKRANGKIVDMWDTGVTINNQPEIGMVIEVTPDFEPSFKAEVKQVISRLQTSFYQVGVTCVVKYDPNNKKTVAIESLGDSGADDNFGDDINQLVEKYKQNALKEAQSGTNFEGSPAFPGMNQQQIEEAVVANDKEIKRIMQIGVECKAIIKTSEFTNVFVNQGNPLYSLILEVLPDDAPAYEAKCMGVILTASVPKYQPGKQVFVKYDPEDRSKITISHS